MRRVLVLLIAALTLFAVVSCSSWVTDNTEHPSYVHQKNGYVFGQIFDGMTRATINTTTNTNLAATLTYSDAGTKGLNVVNAQFVGNYYYFEGIPTDTPFVIQVSAGTTYRPFTYVDDGTSIADNIENGAAAAVLPIYENTTGMVGNINLFPATANAGALTIVLYDASNGQTINSTGTVLLTPSTAPSGNVSLNALANSAATALAKAISATATAGTATAAAADLMLGATYAVSVVGVTGYQVGTSTVTINTSDPMTLRVQLTDTTPALQVVSRSDYDAQGNPVPSSTGAVTFTFNRAVELDPRTASTAEITSIVAPNTDNDAVTSALAAYTGNEGANPPVASNHLTVTVSGTQLTIAVKAGYLTTEDTGDDLAVNFALNQIFFRAAGSGLTFSNLNGFNSVQPGWTTNGTIIVREISSK